MRENLLKKKIKNGESAIGTFVKLTDAAVPELLALAGFDFFVLDTEHRPGGGCGRDYSHCPRQRK